jgi:hypothetical protein
VSDHTTALVPISTWCYNSPDARAAGRSIDIGLFTEALIYYDRVAVSITTQPEFAEFLRWFIDTGCFDDLLALLGDGTIKIYDYSFAILAVENAGVYSLVNIQDEIQAEPNTFERRVLYHQAVQNVLPKARQRERLYKAVRGNVIEAKAADFDKAIENAQEDLRDPRRTSLIVQAYVDELYRFRKLGRPPEVHVSMAEPTLPGTYQINWNVDFNELTRLAGRSLTFHRGTPLNAARQSNRALWSAAQMSCDLYLGRPISALVGDKLYEGAAFTKTHETIESLERTVEFPDVRALVGGGHLGFREVLAIRRKAKRFRDWLQQESERDRDAIIAYHHEVAKETGFTSAARKALSLFGIIGGAVVGAVWTGPSGAVAGVGVGYLLDLAAKLGSDWKPVVFGNWMRERVATALAESHRTAQLNNSTQSDRDSLRGPDG